MENNSALSLAVLLYLPRLYLSQSDCLKNQIMPNRQRELQPAISFLERIADESNDAQTVRGAYRLIRQLEEFVQQLPEQADSSSAAEKPVRAKRMGRKPGKRGKMKRADQKSEQGGVASEGVKRRGRPKRTESPSAESAEGTE